MKRLRATMLALLLPAVIVAQSPPALAVSAKPLTAIGFADSPDNEQLTNVTGAKRLSDGRVVVANGKPLSLRLYSAQGKFLSVISRKGSGPGEVSGSISILAAGGDSLLVFDNTRMTMFSPAGKLVKETPANMEIGSPRGQTILYHRALVQQAVPQDNACIRQLLNALGPLPLPSVREVFPDGAGRFWVHAVGNDSWTVHTSDGRAIGTVRLPKGFRMYQIGDRFIVGKALLEDDIEQVRVYAVSPPPASSKPACVARADSFPLTRPTSARGLGLQAALRGAMTSAEMAFSNLARYPSTIDSFPGVKEKLPVDTFLWVLGGGQRGYALIGFDGRSSLACMFGAGSTLGLIGWPDMVTRCTE